MVKKRKRLKKGVKIGLLAILLIIVAILTFDIYKQLNKQENSVNSEKITVETTSEVVIPEAKADNNSDYRGIIKVGTLVDEKVVQSEDNEYYLNYNADNEKDTQGAIFMDYLNTLDDQNIILYGHYVYYDENAKFTPLTKLTEQANYEDNKYITFEMMDETRTYEIAYVYHYEMNNMNMRYYLTNYGDEFDSYIDYISQKAFYDTGVNISASDHILTLQTCVRNREDLRLIIVAKQIY